MNTQLYGLSMSQSYPPAVVRSGSAHDLSTPQSRSCQLEPSSALRDDSWSSCILLEDTGYEYSRTCPVILNYAVFLDFVRPELTTTPVAGSNVA